MVLYHSLFLLFLLSFVTGSSAAAAPRGILRRQSGSPSPSIPSQIVKASASACPSHPPSHAPSHSPSHVRPSSSFCSYHPKSIPKTTHATPSSTTTTGAASSTAPGPAAAKCESVVDGAFTYYYIWDIANWTKENSNFTGLVDEFKKVAEDKKLDIKRLISEENIPN